MYKPVSMLIAATCEVYGAVFFVLPFVMARVTDYFECWFVICARAARLDLWFFVPEEMCWEVYVEDPRLNN